MSVSPPDRIGQLSDNQIDFYLAEYQRVLRMFEGYSSVEAHQLKARLGRFIEMLRREMQRRESTFPVKKEIRTAHKAA